VVVAVFAEKFWRGFCRAIDRPDLIEDPRFDSNPKRVERRDDLVPVFEAVFPERTTQATETSPNTACGPAMTAASTTPGWDNNTASTSAGWYFTPALLMTSSARPFRKTYLSSFMTATSPDETPPEGWIAGGAECRYCPFTVACGVQRRNLPFQDTTDVDPQFAAEMKDAALSLRTLEKSRDTLDSDVRALQDQIKTRLREKGVRKIPGVLQWSSVKGRAGFDNKAIKQAAIDAGIDVDQFSTLGEPSDRLVITVV